MLAVILVRSLPSKEGPLLSCLLMASFATLLEWEELFLVLERKYRRLLRFETICSHGEKNKFLALLVVPLVDKLFQIQYIWEVFVFFNNIASIWN